MHIEDKRILLLNYISPPDLKKKEHSQVLMHLETPTSVNERLHKKRNWYIIGVFVALVPLFHHFTEHHFKELIMFGIASLTHILR